MLKVENKKNEIKKEEIDISFNSKVKASQNENENTNKECNDKKIGGEYEILSIDFQQAHPTKTLYCSRCIYILEKDDRSFKNKTVQTLTENEKAHLDIEENDSSESISDDEIENIIELER